MSGDKGDELTILAVIFYDHSADGDPRSIGEMQDRRRGEREQLIKVQQLFDDLLNSSSSIDRIALETLRSRIMSLPETGPGEFSFQFRTGLHDVKEDMAREIETILVDEGTRQEGRDRQALDRVNLRSELTKVRNSARSRIASLAAR
jgi:hypothetical protein